MENSDQSDEDNLLNEYVFLKERLIKKDESYYKAINYFQNLNNEIENFIIKLCLLEGDILKQIKINIMFILFNKSIKFFLNNHQKLIREIIQNIKLYSKQLRKLIHLWNLNMHTLFRYNARKKNYMI